jgi:hypothetical protein
MRLLTKIMLGLAVLGVSTQAQAEKYLYKYVPTCSYCENYQTPFSFTWDTLTPQNNLQFDVYPYLGVETAFLNRGGFSVDSSTEFNPDSGLTYNTLSLELINNYVRLSYPDGDYFFEGLLETQPLFYLASDGSLMPLIVATNRDPSVIALKDQQDQEEGYFQVSKIDDVVSPAPEPSTWAMMLVGVGAIGWRMRQKKATVSFG